MEAATLSNLLAYSAQVACIAVLAAIAARLLGPSAAGPRYAFWRGVTLLCLVLPFLQGREVVPGEPVAATASSAAASAVASLPVEVAVPAPSIDWVAAALWVYMAGLVLRLAWIGIGLIQLRRLRGAGMPAPPSEAHEYLQRVVGSRAAIRFVEGLIQPVTFGVLRPVVLLPSALREQPEGIQLAVLGHELFHVQRRDWGWVLVEELVRAVFWFHPAMWWLISRVQLAREEVVDELAVLATGRRRTYVEALLAFADESPLAPAPAFARRRHLFRRVSLLSKEVAMSSRRVVACCAILALVVAVGGWYAVNAFPLQTQDQGSLPGLAAMEQKPGPLESQAHPVTRENPVPKRVTYVPAIYPVEAALAKATGTVTLVLTLDEGGNVAEARVTGVAVRAGGDQVSFNSARETDIMNFARASAAAEGGGTVSPAVQVLPALINAALDAARQWRYEPPATPPISFTTGIGFRADKTTLTAPPPPPPPPPPSWWKPGMTPEERAAAIAAAAQSPKVTRQGVEAEPIRVGGAIKPPTKIKDVRPLYPEEARAARIQGVVILEALVGKDGHVSEAKVLRSIPMLDQAAIDAVMQWQFTPTLLNGVPVPVVMTMTVNFKLE